MTPFFLAQSALGQGPALQLSTLQFIVALCAMLVTVLVPIVVVVRWVVSLKGDIDVVKAEHHGHEDVCALRYKAIEDQAKALERRIDERHNKLEEKTDERHSENRVELQNINGKLDRLLTAKV